MKYIFIMFASLLVITGCGKSQLELEKERIQKEADELKKKIDSTSNYINKERKSLDSTMKSIDSLGKQIDKLQEKLVPGSTNEKIIKKTNELMKQQETPTTEPKKK